MLFTYQQQVQRLIGDEAQQRVPPNDLIYYINQGRRHIAELTQCVRILTPISSSITSIAVNTPAGSPHYTAPVVTISTPDSPSGYGTYPSGLQATATATLVGGSITSITLTNSGGSGYFQPQVTITDATGSGAVATATVGGINTVNIGQEVYNFSSLSLSATPGAASVFAVKSVSILYDNYRYILPTYSFSTYQAFIRNYPFQYQYVPTVCAQYGQGANGSIYFYPLPSQTYQSEWDCFCLPSDLTTDASVDLIPQPWSDSVQYFAAYLAFLQMQRSNDARMMLDLFDKFLLRQSVAARPGKPSNIYGRW